MSATSPTSAGARTVLVFGMDGADWTVLEPLLASGRLPTLARIAREGAVGPLASTIHPHSPTAWASFITGANPGRHGIFDFVRRKRDSYEIEILTTRDRSGRAVWQVLSERGIPCGVVNVPMTHPPEKVLGYFISGTFTANTFANFAYPRSLLDELKRALGRPYRVDVYLGDLSEGPREHGPEAHARWIADVNQVEVERAEASAHLIRRYRPRFVVHVVTATDRVQHAFWRRQDASDPEFDPTHPDRDAVAQSYVAADQALGRLLEATGPDTTVLVVSDHGGAPLHRALFIHEWLEEEGFLQTTRPPAYGPRGLVRAVIRTAYLTARRVLPMGVKRQLSGRFDVWGKTSSKFVKRWDIDWSRTQAFAEGTFGNIRLNVRGRQPLGIVAPGEEYEAVRRRIRERIEALVDPETGEPVVERTYAREELYSGPRVEEAPDVLVVLRRGYQMVGDIVARRYGTKGARQKALFVSGEGNRFGLSGIHSPTGILLAKGAGIAAGSRVAGANITDLAPTILALFGIAPPLEMDGRVLSQLAGAEALAEAPAR